MLHPTTRVPFYGGTYFPIDPKYGRPGFLQLLTALRQFYDTDKARLAEITETVLGNLPEGSQLPESPTMPSDDAEPEEGTFYAWPYPVLATFPPAPTNQVAKTHPWPGRIPPVTDTKLIVAWNSLMISGLAQAGRVLQTASYLATAAVAATYIHQHQWLAGRLHRLGYDGVPQVPAQSEDYALLIKAFIDLHQARLAIPAASTEADWLGLAIANLVRLALLTDDLTYRDRAERTLQAFGTILEQIPRACPSLFNGLNWFLNGTVVKASDDIVAELATEFWPTTVLAIDHTLPTGVAGLVCQGTACLEPADSLATLRQQLQT